MPAITPDQLHCAIYLYRSVAKAHDGIGGGCGFLVGLPGRTVSWHLYAVTNRHVVEDGQCRVLRINTKDGGFKTIQTDIGQWTRGTNDDIAVMPIELDEDRFQVGFIKAESFLGPIEHKQPLFDTHLFHPGDIAVMIGRMVTHDGKQRNRPIVQFGNLAMFPDENEPIELPGQRMQVGFLIDCRSLPGASGSAVLVYRDPERPSVGTGQGYLLGVDCAHLPRWADVYEPDPDRPGEKRRTEYTVEMNSGIAVVVPAWHLMALLNGDALMEQRNERERIEAARTKQETAAVPDIAEVRL